MSFEVDLDELRAAVTGLARLEGTVAQKLADLDGVVGGLQQTWTGEAAAAQESAHAKWTSGAREMHVALGQMRAAAEHAHASYSSAAQPNASMWRQTR